VESVPSAAFKVSPVFPITATRTVSGHWVSPSTPNRQGSAKTGLAATQANTQAPKRIQERNSDDFEPGIHPG
jgi:hypothetical protein